TRAGERVNAGAKMFDPALGGEAIVAHASTMPQARRAALGPRATLVELGTSEVDVVHLLEWLGRERGCKVVLCEGGGVVNASLLAARAIDELFLTIVPRVLGGSSAPTIGEGNGFAPDALPDARLTHVEQVGDELFLDYAFDWTERQRRRRGTGPSRPLALVLHGLGRPRLGPVPDGANPRWPHSRMGKLEANLPDGANPRWAHSRMGSSRGASGSPRPRSVVVSLRLALGRNDEGHNVLALLEARPVDG